MLNIQISTAKQRYCPKELFYEYFPNVCDGQTSLENSVYRINRELLKASCLLQ